MGFWVIDNVPFGDGDKTVRVCHCTCAKLCAKLCLRLFSRCFVRFVIFFSVIGGMGEKRRKNGLQFRYSSLSRLLNFASFIVFLLFVVFEG